jgi:predicted thioesterase
MEQTMNFELKQSVVEDLHTYAALLKKDPNVMLNEALEMYFENAQKKLIEKRLDDENMMTNLDYDEFWDGVDLE